MLEFDADQFAACVVFFRILRHGLAVTELAENDLPGVPSAVFAFKEVSMLPPLVTLLLQSLP